MMRRSSMARGFRTLPALLAISPLLFAGTARATFPGADGRIVFTSNLHGSWQMYSMLPDGGDLTKLTHFKGSQNGNYFADWSPDGRKILFANPGPAGDFDLYIMNADGSGVSPVLGDPGVDDLIPRWSPDGRRIVFARINDFGLATIWVTNATGTGIEQLTGDSYDSFEPLFTPDGQHILFDSQKDGLVAAIWIMDANGKNKKRLTPAGMEAGAIDVSPDGTHLVFINHENTNRPNSLYTMGIDGTGLTRLTHAGCCYHDTQPKYSPDGKRIVFISDREYPHLEGTDIFTIRTDGSGLRRITSNVTLGDCPDDDNCVGPDWGPKPTS